MIQTARRASTRPPRPGGAAAHSLGIAARASGLGVTLAAAALVAAVGCGEAPEREPPRGPPGILQRPPETGGHIDSLFAAYDRPGQPGASLLVLRGDSVLVRESFGLANVEGAVAATPATNYRLASLSKQFTAMAVMLLVKDGKLSLDTPVTDILDRLPPYAHAVRVRHLLTHTSGLWDYEDFVPDTATTQVRDADVVELLRTRTDSLYFDPGSAWRYSNTGYCLLALVVEKVSGMPYAQFLRARIFDPLGMANTVAYEAGVSDVPHRAYGYTVRGDSVIRTDQSPTSATLGDGGIYSSIDDLAKWERALRTYALVDRATWAMMTTPATLNDGKRTEYGFGWFIDHFEGQRRMRHHGETRGFTNFVQRFPDDSLYVVLLTNRTGGDPWDLAEDIARRELGAAEKSRP